MARCEKREKMLKNMGFIKGSLSVILALGVIFSLLQPVLAVSESETPYRLRFDKDGAACSLEVLQIRDTWYVEASSLAKASECELHVNEKTGELALFRGKDITILYKADKKTYLKRDSEVYLPLQEATASVGLQFHVSNDSLHAKQLRTPGEIMTQLSSVFRENRFSTTQMIVDLGTTYAVAEELSRIYALLPLVGSSNIIAEAIGAGERNRYEEAFATILATEGSLSEFISDTKSFQTEIKKSDKILDNAKKVLDRDGNLATFLNKKGIDREILDYFTTEFSNYSNEALVFEFFDGFNDGIKAANLGEFLNIMTFYSSALDSEEAIAQAMVSVFKDSDSRIMSDAANDIFSARYGRGLRAGTSVLGEWIGDRVFDLIYEKAEDKALGLEGFSSLKALLITKAIDYSTGASDKSNAILYTTIYSSIQQELASYYYKHAYDSEEDTIMILRAVGIMYLKAALAAYENYEFDKKLDEAIENAKNTITYELVSLLDYSEQEYRPDYDNACLIEWVNTHKLEGIDWSPEVLLGKPLSEAIAVWGDYSYEDGYLGSKFIGFKNGCGVHLEYRPGWWDETSFDDYVILYIHVTEHYTVNGFSPNMTLAEFETVAESKALVVEAQEMWDPACFSAWCSDENYTYWLEWYSEDYTYEPYETPSDCLVVGKHN